MMRMMHKNNNNHRWVLWEFLWEFLREGLWKGLWASVLGESVNVRGISALFFFENVIRKREVAREEPLRRPAYMVEKAIVFILNFLMLNGQALKRRQTLRIVGLCYACFGAFELFLHARIPTFTATFGKNRVEML